MNREDEKDDNILVASWINDLGNQQKEMEVKSLLMFIGENHVL